jgi:cytochrome P450
MFTDDSQWCKALTLTDTVTMELPHLNFVFYAQAAATLLILYVTYRFVKVLIRRLSYNRRARQRDCQSVKRVPCWDLILGLDFFYKLLKEFKQHTTLESSRKRFDEYSTNTVMFPLLGETIIETREPENVKALLSTQFDDFGLEALRKDAIPLVGRGIFTTDGSEWQHSRSLLKPMFTRNMLDTSVFATHVDRLLANIPYDSTTIDLQPLFFRLTTDTTSHLMIGESTDVQIHPTNTPGSAFADAFSHGIAYFGSDPINELSPLVLPTPQRRQFNRDCATLKAFVTNKISTARAEQSKPLAPGSDPNRNILLYDLIAQGEPDHLIHAEVMNTMLAGRDTSGSLLSDLWFELSKHPRVFTTLQREINQFCPEGTELTFELLKGLPYLRGTMNEVLRIHPVVPGNARIALRNTTLPLGGGKDGMGKVFVPKGTFVGWSLYCMHRREDLWDSPDEFRPERWLDDPTTGEKGVRPGWSWLPFNGGPRVCVGQQMALLVVGYVVVRMVQGMEEGEGALESRDPEEWRENVRVTCVGLNGCRVGIRGREMAREKS